MTKEGTKTFQLDEYLCDFVQEKVLHSSHVTLSQSYELGENRWNENILMYLG